MDLVLTRKRSAESGIYGELTTATGLFVADTLEHAYPEGNFYYPKVPPGAYICRRGTHVLHDGVPFITFEVTEVPGHTGILFHTGNVNQDSEGCILLGEGMTPTHITESRRAFVKFMLLQSDVNEFTLTVNT
jgi:hypothetical protein